MTLSASGCAVGVDSSFLSLLDTVMDAEFQRLVEEAESTRAFPRRVIERLGSAGVFSAEWTDSAHPNLSLQIALGERLGSLGAAGISVGTSLHDSAIAILRRFGKSGYLKEVAQRAIAGESVLCIGASEPTGGSDLENVTSTAVPEQGGYRIQGHKKFVSLSRIADVVLLVVRAPDPSGPRRHGDVAMFAVPRDQVTVGEVYRTVGANCLDTAPISFDTWVPDDAMVARPGIGLACFSWGLAHERLSIASQVLGICDVAIAVTVARMKQRTQFGSTLFDHQALRLRMADLDAQVDMLRWALRGIAADGSSLNLRTAAAMKVTAARLGERVLSECMHIFGGTGYLVDQSPLGRWWRDMKLGRVGGGTDEVLWELVAAGMQPDYERYNQLINEDDNRP